MGPQPSLLLALAATSLSAMGAPEPPPGKAEASATVTVTAEASPVEILKTPNPVKVLDREAILATGARTLDELLPALLPGQIQAFGGPGSAASLYLGGGRARDVVVLLDGIRITDPTALSANFADFTLDGVDRVEVLQGPSSTRYGSDAHGGVIALWTAAPAKAGFSLEAQGAAGNRGARKAGVAPAYGWEGGWVKASASAAREDASIPADDPFRTASASVNAGQRIGEDGLLTLTGRTHFRGTPLPFTGDYLPPTWAYTRVFDPARGETERDSTVVAAWRQALGAAWALEASFGHVAQDRFEPGYGGGAPAERYRGQRNQAVANLTWAPVRGVSAALMLDHSGESAGLAGDEARATHDAVALEGAWEMPTGLRAVISGRWQHDTVAYTFASGQALPDRASDRFVYKAGLNWTGAQGLRLYASYGTSYNAPDLFSLTHNLANGYGGLDDERSHGGQAGASLRRGAWTFKLEASRTFYDHVVAYQDLGSYAYKYVNGTDLRVQGLEASAAREGASWRAEAFVRSQEARNMSQPGDAQLTTSGATGRPFFTAGLRGEAVLGPWRASARWAHTGSSYQYFDDLGAVDGLRTHLNDLGIALGRSAGRHLTWTLRGEHLLQRTWSREDWLAGRPLRRNDAYLVPVFPVAGPTFTLELKYRS
ncbi:TonB-dependent receptor plug domain-containing protein [Mesoterricola sediminis]|uniref:Ligand-gated channel n=1 Tax=Mesoterricola sediminis TaxID=2927980 RepID=A0AA48KE36_9BACT|nr:TonB-dependent receptor [Mesoterricola sediminis]BDU75083.1 ligand-gated channel [Mesoterricola sediminis]